jgi:hypothetical protein
MTKLFQKSSGLVLGALAGLVAGAAFRRTWKTVTRQDDAPDPTDEDRRWAEILVAAALEGAIFGVTRAAVDRGTAAGMKRLTGRWPS